MAIEEFEKTKLHYLVIGIDFGTTHTGISYTWSAKYEDDEDIITVTEWPALGGQTENTTKVPTQIAYERDESGRATNCWGYLIKPGVPRCVWMKLLLDKKARVTPFDDPNLRRALEEEEQRLPQGKTVEEVTTDFFRELYEFTMQRLRQDYPDILLDMTPIKYCFTMPAIWSDEAQLKTLWAAEAAGFAARPVDEVTLISEPEAAAMATLTGSLPRYGDRVLAEEPCILVCDCGGGTVDLTAYKVVGSDPWKLELEECYVGDGGKCGAVNLDRNLRDLLSARFGDEFDSLPDHVKSSGSLMMYDFERNKQIFDDPCPRLRQLRLLMNVEDSEHYDSFDSSVILSEKDMKTIFDPVVDQIIKLVAGQVRTARKSSGPNVTYLLPIGGLSDSPYLRNRLRKWCLEHRIHMGGPKDSWGAVVRGAVIRGLERATVVRKKCRRHYGTTSTQVYEPSLHGVNPPGGVHFWPLEGKDMVFNCMSWSINRGATIEPGGFKPINFFSWLRDSDRHLEIPLKSCSLPEAPRWFTEENIEESGTIVADLTGVDYAQFRRQPCDGEIRYRIEYTLEVVLGHEQGTVYFRVRISGEVISHTKVRLDDDPHNRSPEQIFPDLVKRLIEVGLRPQMITIVKGKLALNIKREFLTLSPVARDQAYKAVQSDYREPTLKLVEKLVKHLRDVLELEAKSNEARRGWRGPPGGPRGTWTKYSQELQPPDGPQDGPETAQEFLAYYEDFLSKNFGQFRFSDELKQSLAERAVKVKKELETNYGLTAKEVANLTKVSFYDIFFLCDDSTSMQMGDRIDALNETLQSITFWATMIEPSGVSLRFLNYDDDDNGDFDNFTDLGKLRDQITKPTREKENRMADVIRKAKTDADGLAGKFGPAVTIFLVAMVGKDKEAVGFLRELKGNPTLSSMVYTFTEPLDEVLEVLAKQAGHTAYKTLWMRLFNAALTTQTK
ncbi:hypothetical protein ATETN484_0015000600 [Aspergillus terreus]|nr:hypothetical protein ATETN484_0015000600 [Aspergillus terreus]